MRWGYTWLLKPLVFRIWAKCKGGIKQLGRKFYPQDFIQTTLSSSFITIPSQAGKGESWENFLAFSSHELDNSSLPPCFLCREQTDPIIPMRKTVEGKVKHIVVVVVESGGSAQSYPLDGPSSDCFLFPCAVSGKLLWGTTWTQAFLGLRPMWWWLPAVEPQDLQSQWDRTLCLAALVRCEPSPSRLTCSFPPWLLPWTPCSLGDLLMLICKPLFLFLDQPEHSCDNSSPCWKRIEASWFPNSKPHYNPPRPLWSVVLC